MFRSVPFFIIFIIVVVAIVVYIKNQKKIYIYNINFPQQTTQRNENEEGKTCP